MNNNNSFFVDIGFSNQAKHGQAASGDVFLSKKKYGYRTIGVLADGLGSGIKANVLATITSTMAMKFISEDMDMKKAAGIIMRTLPLCKERKIGYCTFSILDAQQNGDVRIVEYDNPEMLVFRGTKQLFIKKETITINTTHLGERSISSSTITPKIQDRIIFFTDGITQSGIGRDAFMLGWTQKEAARYAQTLIKENPVISARELSRKIVAEAHKIDSHKAKDDISCMVTYFRKPRKMLVVTGPPFHKDKDKEIARQVQQFQGTKALCGGTTAEIISRELGNEVSIDLSEINHEIPPYGFMDGVDLVTEGALTLSKVAEYLRNDTEPESQQNNAAVKLLKMFINADTIHFIVGTRINEAHQDPNLPAELDIRRNLIKRIVKFLKEKQMKEATFEFI